FGIDAGIRSGCVDECQNGPTKLLGDFHDAQRFTVALRFRHTEIPELPLLGVPSLLMANQADGRIPDQSKPADHGSIVTKLAVTVDLDEVRAQMFYIIEEVRSLRVPCELYLLVRRKLIHSLVRTIRDEPCHGHKFFQRTPQIRGRAKSLHKD